MLVTDLHRQAIEFADDAFLARMRGDVAASGELFARAFELEVQAATAFANERSAEPTRSVLLRSAATLAMHCGREKEARRLIYTALAGDPPPEIEQELLDLLEEVAFRRHLALRGITLDDEEMQLSLAGDAVSFGMAHSSHVTERVITAEKLFLRTCERRRGMKFRESGAPKKAVKEDFQFYQSVPRAASFAITLRVGRPTEQLRLPETTDVRVVIDDVLEGLEMVNGGALVELERRINDDAYYTNFVGLAKRLAPDGKSLSCVGFTTVRDGRPKEVALRRPAREITLVGVASRGSHVDTSRPRGTVTVMGRLGFANELQPSSSVIQLVDDENKTHRILVPRGMMADIVKPLWGETVSITGEVSGGSLRLIDINRPEQ